MSDNADFQCPQSGCPLASLSLFGVAVGLGLGAGADRQQLEETALKERLLCEIQSDDQLRAVH